MSAAFDTYDDTKDKNNLYNIQAPPDAIKNIMEFVPQLNGNYPTGYQVEVKVPLIEDSMRPLFCISQNPYRYNMFAQDMVEAVSGPTTQIATMLHALTHPVFITDWNVGKENVRIVDKGYVHYQDFLAACHATVSGSVGVTVHISSSTETKGKIRAVPYDNYTRVLPFQFPTPERDVVIGPYDSKGKKVPYQFVRPAFQFAEPFGKHIGAVKGMQTIDLSLNRSALIPSVPLGDNSSPPSHSTLGPSSTSSSPSSISASICARPQQALSFNTHFYWRSFANYADYSGDVNPDFNHRHLSKYNLSYNLFKDSGVGFFTEGDISAANPGILTFEIDFDYSNVQFSNPIFPLVPSVGTTTTETGVQARPFIVSDTYATDESPAPDTCIGKAVPL